MRGLEGWWFIYVAAAAAVGASVVIASANELQVRLTLNDIANTVSDLARHDCIWIVTRSFWI